MLNQRITKQAQDGDAQLHGRIGESTARLDGEDIATLWMWPIGEVLDVECHLLARNGFRLNMLLCTEPQEIVERTSVGVDRIGRQLQVDLCLKPGPGEAVVCNEWVAFPTHSAHSGFPPEKILLLRFPVLCSCGGDERHR
jgi:hypothetical protein